ncbi:Alpha beta-hydrolase [Rhizoctonia solani]|uniref:Alpha beta-hydrolase n=1 Tax=Rhizoctonia solani TaxID=456999 RepID=A0A8H7HFD0_9AGAM|nr:Alpha beta-hydrolase [Rhizoctonia solani]
MSMKQLLSWHIDRLLHTLGFSQFAALLQRIVFHSVGRLGESRQFIAAGHVGLFLPMFKPTPQCSSGPTGSFSLLSTSRDIWFHSSGTLIYCARVSPCFGLVVGSCLKTTTNRCHLGQSIIYDTVTELHWSADIRTHGIVVVIEQLLAADWSEQTGKSNNKKGWWGRKPQALLQSSTHRRLSEDIGTSLEDRVEVPTPKPEDDCVECYIWEFGDYMNDTIRK